MPALNPCGRDMGQDSAWPELWPHKFPWLEWGVYFCTQVPAGTSGAWTWDTSVTRCQRPKFVWVWEAAVRLIRESWDGMRLQHRWHPGTYR